MPAHARKLIPVNLYRMMNVMRCNVKKYFPSNTIYGLSRNIYKYTRGKITRGYTMYTLVLSYIMCRRKT